MTKPFIPYNKTKSKIEDAINEGLSVKVANIDWPVMIKIDGKSIEHSFPNLGQAFWVLGDLEGVNWK